MGSLQCRAIPGMNDESKNQSINHTVVAILELCSQSIHTFLHSLRFSVSRHDVISLSHPMTHTNSTTPSHPTHKRRQSTHKRRQSTSSHIIITTTLLSSAYRILCFSNPFFSRQLSHNKIKSCLLCKDRSQQPNTITLHTQYKTNTMKLSFALIAATVVSSASAFAPSHSSAGSSAVSLRMSTEEAAAPVATPPKPLGPTLNGWTPDASKPCYGLPGAISPLGYFDPLGFCTDRSLDGVKRFREAEILHGRVGMMAVLGYLIGENTPTITYGFDTPTIGNNQIPEVNFGVMFAFFLTINISEAYRASKGWVEPGMGNLFTLRENYYPGKKWPCANVAVLFSSQRSSLKHILYCFYHLFFPLFRQVTWALILSASSLKTPLTLQTCKPRSCPTDASPCWPLSV